MIIVILLKSYSMTRHICAYRKEGHYCSYHHERYREEGLAKISCRTYTIHVRYNTYFWPRKYVNKILNKRLLSIS